jgi:hypothetical protein
MSTVCEQDLFQSTFGNERGWGGRIEVDEVAEDLETVARLLGDDRYVLYNQGIVFPQREMLENIYSELEAARKLQQLHETLTSLYHTIKFRYTGMESLLSSFADARGETREAASLRYYFTGLIGRDIMPEDDSLHLRSCLMIRRKS